MAQETFCLEYYTSRIQKILINEFGINMTTEDIEQNIVKIVSAKDKNKAIAEYFKISNISDIAQIIQLFLTVNAG